MLHLIPVDQCVLLQRAQARQALETCLDGSG
jgi:hypothetical protein